MRYLEADAELNPMSGRSVRAPAWALLLPLLPLLALLTPLLLAATAGAADGTKPASGPSAARGGRQPTPEVLVNAVKELTQQAEAFLKDPTNAAPLRTECDFFDGQPEGVEPAAVFALLDTPIHRNPLVAGYVKWQLMGAIPTRFDDADVKTAVVLYRKAPPITARPGTDPKDQAQLATWLKSVKDDMAVIEANKKYAALSAIPRRQNKVIMAYRDEIYRRLPKNADAFRLRLQDLYERVGQGWDCDDDTRSMIIDLRAWLNVADNPQEVLALADLLVKLRWHKGPSVYEHIMNDKGDISWKQRTFYLNFDWDNEPTKDGFLMLAAELRAAAQNVKAQGGSGLRLKDDKPDAPPDKKDNRRDRK